MEAFRAIGLPTAPGAVRLGPEACPGCRVGKTTQGDLALLIDVAGTGASTPRRLQNLLYEPPQLLSVHSEGGKVRLEHLAVLTCRTSEVPLQVAFLRIAQALLDGGTGSLTETVLEGRLDELVVLFRALGRPAKQTVQGLWCELAMIAWSMDPRLALASWHSGPRALHDFEATPHRLEVKSCATGLREHGLRLEQLQEAPGGRTLFASILVEETDCGMTVRELCDHILSRVGDDAELKRRLETIVTHSLGRDWQEAATRRYLLAKARADLRVYRASRIPSVPGPIPAEVKHVHFVVDLSTTETLALADARAIAPFFRDLLPPDACLS